MTWIDDIKKRLGNAHFKPLDKCSEVDKFNDIYRIGAANTEFIWNAPEDIANLLEERTVLREALEDLKIYLKYHDNDNGDWTMLIETALAWVPASQIGRAESEELGK